MESIISSILDLVLECVIGIAIILVTKVVIPWLQDTKLYDVVKKLVRAAEKLNESGQLDGETKYKYVIRQLIQRGYTENDKTKSYIEAAVKELDIEQDTGAWLSVPEAQESIAESE